MYTYALSSPFFQVAVDPIFVGYSRCDLCDVTVLYVYKRTFFLFVVENMVQIDGLELAWFTVFGPSSLNHDGWINILYQPKRRTK